MSGVGEARIGRAWEAGSSSGIGLVSEIAGGGSDVRSHSILPSEY